MSGHLKAESCSICQQRSIHVIELRPSGRKGKLQRAGYCWPCAEMVASWRNPTEEHRHNSTPIGVAMRYRSTLEVGEVGTARS